MKAKEAKARIKINKLLEAAGWRFFDSDEGPADIQVEANVKITKKQFDNFGEDFEKVKNGFIDFLLLDEQGKPFVVLEAKSEDKDPLVGKDQARKYAQSKNLLLFLERNPFWSRSRKNCIWFFRKTRNSLVRANYNELKRGVHETTEYLELFLRNLLLGERHELHNRYRHISKAIQKQDIGDTKQDFESKKQDIDGAFPHGNVLKMAGASAKTADHVRRMFAAYGFETIFGRSDVTELLSITPSPASTLLKKLADMGVTEAVSGLGKGKYRFKPVG